MFILANLFSATAKILHSVIWLYTWILIVSALLSWVRPDPYNPFVKTLRTLTEPVLWRVRRHLPFTYFSGIDLSPVVIILTLQFIDMFLVQSLAHLAITMR